MVGKGQPIRIGESTVAANDGADPLGEVFRAVHRLPQGPAQLAMVIQEQRPRQGLLAVKVAIKGAFRNLGPIGDLARRGRSDPLFHEQLERCAGQAMSGCRRFRHTPLGAEVYVAGSTGHRAGESPRAVRRILTTPCLTRMPQSV